MKTRFKTDGLKSYFKKRAALAKLRKFQASKLEEKWNDFLKNKPTGKHLSDFIRNIKSLSLQKKALKLFLKMKGVDFEDYSDLFGSDFVIKRGGTILRRTFWHKCFALATTDDWIETINFPPNETVREIFLQGLEEGIKKGLVPEKEGREILLEVFEKMPEDKIRKRCWELLKNLNPREKDLLKIAGLDCMNVLIGINSEIRSLLDKIKRGKFVAEQQTKLFLGLTEEMNKKIGRIEKTKKGQF